MIHPDGLVKKTWNLILTFLLLYTAIVMPYRMAFLETEKYDDWYYVELTVDALFFLDLILNFFSAYYSDDGTLIIGREQIAITYARSWFILDLIA